MITPKAREGFKNFKDHSAFFRRVQPRVRVRQSVRKGARMLLIKNMRPRIRAFSFPIRKRTFLSEYILRFSGTPTQLVVERKAEAGVACSFSRRYEPMRPPCRMRVQKYNKKTRPPNLQPRSPNYASEMLKSYPAYSDKSCTSVIYSHFRCQITSLYFSPYLRIFNHP